MTNAAGHADARIVAVEVLHWGEAIRVAVGDDGRGFNMEEPSTGIGLTGMRERISLAGGRLEIKSSSRGHDDHGCVPCGESPARRG